MAGEVYAKIERQCTWWEIFSKVIPISGVIIFLAVWYVSRELIETVIATGISLMCVTFAIWWYWAINSVAHLARSNWIMHEKIKNIHEELCSARQELQDIKTSLK